MMHKLVDKSLKEQPDVPPLPAFKKELKGSITKRFHLDKLTSDCVDVLAAALDPRFRHLSFLTLSQQLDVKETLIQRASGIDASQPCTAAHSSAPSASLQSKATIVDQY